MSVSESQAWFWLSVAAVVISTALALAAWHRAAGWRGAARNTDEAADHLGMLRLRHFVLGVGASVAPFRIFVAGATVAVYLLCLPVAATVTGWPKALFGALYSTMQVFLAGADLGQAFTVFATARGGLALVETMYLVVLFALAPFLTVGFVLTFFQTFSAHVRYALNYWRDVNVFTELNERSIALARSLRKADRKTCLVFTDVVVATNDPSTELIGQARRLGAIFFKKDAMSLPLTWHSKRASLQFFVIGSQEPENVQEAVAILANPAVRDREHTHLYLFSDTIEADLLMRRHRGRVRVRHIKYARAIVHHWLWREPPVSGDTPASATPVGWSCGKDLFHTACGTGPDRTVSAVIIGAGDHGMEMLRALSWYCQMDTADATYRLHADLYDRDPWAKDRFEREYPELASADFDDAGPSEYAPRQDALYRINVHPGMDATSPALIDAVTSDRDTSFVFISLGDDSTNLEVALRLRREYASRGECPLILTVARDSATIRAALAAEMDSLRDREVPRIALIGDTAEVYSCDTILRQELEWNGLVCHMQWAEAEHQDLVSAIESFWADEYAYRSSIAVPIHWRARRALGVPGANLSPDERTESQRESLRRIEHARWAAFMRSEGYRYGEVKDPVIAKTHYLLVPYDRLPEKEREKDDNDSRDSLQVMKRQQEELERALPTSERRVTSRRGVVKRTKGGHGSNPVSERRQFIETAERYVEPGRA